MKDWQELLDNLTAQLDRKTIDLVGAAQQVTHYVQREIGCSRATLWLIGAEAGGTALRRLACYDGDAGASLDDTVVRGPASWASDLTELTSRGVYVCSDTLAEERLALMRDTYYVPEGIRAVAYATVGANGKTSALLCCSHGEMRTWTAQEVRTLKSCADAISLRRARRLRREAEARSLAQRLLGDVPQAPRR